MSGDTPQLGEPFRVPVGSALQTPLCDLFGVKFPIVQTGMGWVSGARLTSATCEAGGLGILASATMTLPELRTAIGKVKSRTSNPFGVNLLPNQADLLDRIEVMVAEGVKVASFAGAPSPDVVARLNDAGLATIVTVGAKRHAEKMVKIGVSALIAQGGEGGGHTGATPTSLLLPAVVDATEGSGVPVLGAGGFYDGRGLVAALAYGAQGIAMGTRFLLTQESHVPDHVKDIYVGTPVTGTVVTSAIDGAPQRVIRTDMIDSLEKTPAAVRFPAAARNALRFAKLSGTPLRELVKSGLEMRKAQDLTWAQLALAANAPMMTKAGVVDGKVEAGILPTGQVVGSIEELPSVAEVIARIVAEAEATLARLGA
ncbi:MAG TPA: nitronate monooxygenase family protein [Microthrixaceae bacterium]|nr:nitronate monooxygenase family protein [Microthrixaceae bacterium]HNI34170.1 nitronate monooxygenase family protein [Microthrixaceae bacterium]